MFAISRTMGSRRVEEMVEEQKLLKKQNRSFIYRFSFIGKEIKMADFRALFFKAYSNLPADERSQVIIVIDGKPYSWDRAYDEIKAKTELGEKILDRMKELGILYEQGQ